MLRRSSDGLMPSTLNQGDGGGAQTSLGRPPVGRHPRDVSVIRKVRHFHQRTNAAQGRMCVFAAITLLLLSSPLSAAKSKGGGEARAATNIMEIAAWAATIAGRSPGPA